MPDHVWGRPTLQPRWPALISAALAWQYTLGFVFLTRYTPLPRGQLAAGVRRLCGAVAHLRRRKRRRRRVRRVQDPVEGQCVAQRVAQRACRLRKSRSTGVSTRAPLIVRYSVGTHAPVRVQRHTDQDCIYDRFSVSADGPHAATGVGRGSLSRCRPVTRPEGGETPLGSAGVVGRPARHARTGGPCRPQSTV